jgi:C4-type Zn-finger protein
MPDYYDLEHFDDAIFSDAVKGVLSRQSCPVKGCGGQLRWRVPQQRLQVGEIVTFIAVCKKCGERSELEMKL